MFRPMRRKAKEISTDAAKRLLCNERLGVFAVNGDDGYPYTIILIIRFRLGKIISKIISKME